MKIFNPLFFALFLLLSSSLSAQLSSNSQIWNGGLKLDGNSDGVGLYANPSAMHFLSPNFAVGGQLQVLGDYSEGIHKILLSPEIRYYFNPRQKKVNWFAGLGSRIEAYHNPEVSSSSGFQLIPSIGNNVSLGKGLTLENKLSVAFDGNGIDDFFRDPLLEFSSSFVYVRNPLQQDDDQPMLSAVRKGSWMFSGSWLNGTYRNFSSVRNLEFSFSPSLGYFISDRLLLGADLAINYGHLKTDFTLEEQNFTRSLFSASLSPYLRYYTAKSENKVQPYFELRGNLLYTENIQKGMGAGPSTINRSFTGSIGGGVDIFLSNNVALEVGLNLSRDFQAERTQVGLQLGLKYFLNR